jgi:hypothetical protein
MDQLSALAAQGKLTIQTRRDLFRGDGSTKLALAAKVARPPDKDGIGDLL